MSPYSIIRKGEKFQVKNKDTGRILAKKTTKTNATKMIKLLNTIFSKFINIKNIINNFLFHKLNDQVKIILIYVYTF